MAWKPLRLSPSAAGHLPPLLISQSFRRNSYTVQLTDLTCIWSESLDRSEIIRRSREQNTSIDPSDGDQMQIFLDKVKAGLAGGKDTTLALTISADRPSLVLNITVKLPGGLDPLEWSIQLATAPQSVMTSQFTIPLLKAQHAQVQDIESLVEVVKEKDHVIQKLLDKLEGQGTELGQIFPQAAGRVGRKVDRKHAEERVKGLGLFNMDAWRKSRDHEISRDVAGLIGDVFRGNNAEAFEVENNSPATEEPEHWWESIKGITINLDTGKFSTNGLSGARKSPPKSKRALRKEETIEDDEDFQVQAPPPRLARSPKRIPPRLVTNDSTDDDELDVPTQRSKIPDSFPLSPPPVSSSSKKTKKLGSIGAKKAAAKLDPPDEVITEDEASPLSISDGDKSTASPTPPPERNAPEKSQRKLGRIGGKREEPPPEPERDSSPPPAKIEPAPGTSKPKKGKLGQIGAKNKRAETPPPAEKAPEASKAETPKRKLGAIGHKHQSPTTKKEVSQTEELEIRGRASVKPEKEQTPQPRETSEERADRKRQELKRELEEKAKAPVKKKRKF